MATGANDNVFSTSTPQSTANNNQLSTSAYDQAGNVINDGLNQYVYDPEGRVCAIVNATTGAYQYVYDAEGRRVAKGQFKTGTTPPSGGATCAAPTSALITPTALYLLDQDGKQITELNGSGVWQHSNTWSGARIEATYASSLSGVWFHFTDPLGTRRVMADWTGKSQQTCQSLPFGSRETCTESPTEQLFTGKERDAESGNDYFGARYYASSMGRFMSPDWSAVISPVPYAHLEDPQSLNLYAYVRNNPLSHTDPDGHDCTVDGEKHGSWWCFGHALGFRQTKAEQVKDARFYENQYWTERGVAPKDRPQLNNDQVLNAYHNGAFAKPDNAYEQMEAGLIGGVAMYRGGSSLFARAMDVKIDPETGLLKTSRGISLSTDPNGLARFGGAHEIESIPEELEIKQVGQNPNHYELTPKQPMTMEQYQNLLNQVKFK